MPEFPRLCVLIFQPIVLNVEFRAELNDIVFKQLSGQKWHFSRKNRSKNTMRDFYLIFAIFSHLRYRNTRMQICGTEKLQKQQLSTFHVLC